jgi:hypothetical protein
MQTIEKCRICGSTELETVMSLGTQHLTGRFPRQADEAVTAGPVDLVRCAAAGGCGLVQLLQSYDLSEMYGANYGYRSGLNPSMVRHLQAKVARILGMNVLRPGDLVIDIGSNDATTLRAYPEGQFTLLGIDPSAAKFAHHYPAHVNLVVDFFSAAAVQKSTGGRKAKVITSFSMFYDLEDPVQFAREICASLDEDGIWVFEQSYLPAMLRANAFDTICHEHLEFYALRQIMWIAEAAALKILAVEFNDVNGGSASIMAAKAESRHEADATSIAAILDAEREMGVDDGRAFHGFRARVEQERQRLMQYLRQCRADGKRVCGLGASTKGNVLLQYYGIDTALVEAIGEVNDDKFGAFTPGTRIPIRSEAEVLASKPDALLVLPWHFRDYFVNNPELKGRELVFPLPTFEVVTP